MVKIDLIKASKETAKFSVPLVGFRMIGMISRLLAMLLIAMLGQRELAASALVVSVQTTLNMAVWAIVMSIAVIAGYVVGQGKLQDLGKLLRQGCLLSVLLSLPMMFVFWNVGPVLRFFHQQEALIALIQPYFHVLAFGVLPALLYICFLQFMTGIGKPRIILYFSVMNGALILGLGYLLIFGKFGLPKLGMVGMAYANTLMYWLTFLMSLIYLLINPHCKKYQVFKRVKNEGFYYLRKILSIGIPISVQFTTELLAYTLGTIMIGWMNQASLAAMQIVMQLNMVVIMGPSGVGQASSILIGKSLGQGNKKATRTYSEAGLLIGVAFTFLVAIIYLFFPKFLIHFYSVDVTDPANKFLVHTAVLLFIIAAFSQIFDGIRNVATSALRGFQDTVAPMWISILVSWGVSIPLGYLIGFKLHGGAPGFSIGFLVAWLLGSAVLLKRLYQKTGVNLR